MFTKWAILGLIATISTQAFAKEPIFLRSTEAQVMVIQLEQAGVEMDSETLKIEATGIKCTSLTGQFDDAVCTMNKNHTAKGMKAAFLMNELLYVTGNSTLDKEITVKAVSCQTTFQDSKNEQDLPLRSDLCQITL